MSSLFSAPKIDPPEEPNPKQASKEAKRNLNRINRSRLDAIFRGQQGGLSQLKASGLGGVFSRGR